jgi:hypothetical protein
MAPTKPVLSRSPLTEEQLNVYRGFLDTLSQPLHIKNLANLTIPFDFKGFPESRPCLKGIELENLSESGRLTHEFGPEILKGRELRLVDRHKQLQLFRKQSAGSANQSKQGTRNAAEAGEDEKFVIFSEIPFDTKRQLALVKYILVCGEHCDSGGTLVMERVGGRWAPRYGFACASFINNSWSEMPD